MDQAHELDPGGLVRLDPPCAGPEALHEIALVAVDLAPGDWLVIDDAESFFEPHMSRRNAMRVLLQYRRNLGISVALAAKDPMDFPRQVRNNTDLWIVHPEGDVDVLTWERRAGVPTDPLPRGVFVAGRRGGPWSTITADRFEKGLDTLPLWVDTSPVTSNEAPRRVR